MTNSLNNSIKGSAASNHSYGNSMMNIGGTGIIRVQKSANARNTTPFSVIQMDLIQIVSKQTLLALMDFSVIVTYTVTRSVIPDSSLLGAVLYDTLAPSQYGVTSLAIWLSFEFANKQYQCLFGKCDSCCLKCAKCVIEKLKIINK